MHCCWYPELLRPAGSELGTLREILRCQGSSRGLHTGKVGILFAMITLQGDHKKLWAYLTEYLTAWHRHIKPAHFPNGHSSFSSGSPLQSSSAFSVSESSLQIIPSGRFCLHLDTAWSTGHWVQWMPRITKHRIDNRNNLSHIKFKTFPLSLF